MNPLQGIKEAWRSFWGRLVWILPGFKARRALKKLIKACEKDGTDPVEVITKVALERGWTVTKREPNQVELKGPSK